MAKDFDLSKQCKFNQMKPENITLHFSVKTRIGLMKAEAQETPFAKKDKELNNYFFHICTLSATIYKL